MQAIHAWTNVCMFILLNFYKKGVCIAYANPLTDVLSMVEMAAAIMVVCLPALKSLIRNAESTVSKTGATTNNSRSNAYRNYGPGSGHIKLGSGRDAYAIPTRVTTVGVDSDEMELTNMRRGSGVIYKTERVSISSIRREDVL